MKEDPSLFSLLAAITGGFGARDYPSCTHGFSPDRHFSKKFGKCKFRKLVAEGYYEQVGHIHPRHKRSAP